MTSAKRIQQLDTDLSGVLQHLQQATAYAVYREVPSWDPGEDFILPFTEIGAEITQAVALILCIRDELGLSTRDDHDERVTEALKRLQNP